MSSQEAASPARQANRRSRPGPRGSGRKRTLSNVARKSFRNVTSGVNTSSTSLVASSPRNRQVSWNSRTAVANSFSTVTSTRRNHAGQTRQQGLHAKGVVGDGRGGGDTGAGCRRGTRQRQSNTQRAVGPFTTAPRASSRYSVMRSANGPLGSHKGHASTVTTHTLSAGNTGCGGGHARGCLR